MGQGEKKLAAMRANPRDWRIDDLKTVARAFGIAWRDTGGSHVVFLFSDGRHLSVPARRPIHPRYVSIFVSMVSGDAKGA